MLLATARASISQPLHNCLCKVSIAQKPPPLLAGRRMRRGWRGRCRLCRYSLGTLPPSRSHVRASPQIASQRQCSLQAPTPPAPHLASVARRGGRRRSSSIARPKELGEGRPSRFDRLYPPARLRPVQGSWCDPDATRSAPSSTGDEYRATGAGRIDHPPERAARSKARPSHGLCRPHRRVGGTSHQIDTGGLSYPCQHERDADCWYQKQLSHPDDAPKW